ncbi:hypothetical protein V6L77_23900 [Pannonibacter sp. Pt2-lr]
MAGTAHGRHVLAVLVAAGFRVLVCVPLAPRPEPAPLRKRRAALASEVSS